MERSCVCLPEGGVMRCDAIDNSEDGLVVCVYFH